MRLSRRSLTAIIMTVGLLFVAAIIVPQPLSPLGVINAASYGDSGGGTGASSAPFVNHDEDEDADDEDEDEDADELETQGVVTSFSSTRLALDNGMSFAITSDTEIEGVVEVGGEVEVEYEGSTGNFVAIEIDADFDEDGDEDDADDEDEDADDEDEDEMEFEGIVASINGTELVLQDGTTFQINEDTEIEGDVVVGGEVEVDAVLLALVLEPVEDENDEMEFQGVVASISSTRLMLRNGTSFVINSDTKFEINARVGMEVEVDAVESNGSLIATDVDALVAEDEEDETKFIGTVASVMVTLEDGTTIMLNGDTEVEGFLGVGAEIDVDTVLLALEIDADNGEDGDEDDQDDGDEDEGDEDDSDGEGDGYDNGGEGSFKSRGLVTRLNGSSISLDTGRSFRLTDSTKMQSGVQVGAQVEVSFDISMGVLVARTVSVSRAAEGSNDSEEIDLNDLQAEVDNRFYPLPPLTHLVYEGVEDGEESIVEIRVLPDTMEIAGIDVTVALVEEYEGGALTERTLDFYAQTEDGTAIYIGEYVDKIEDGVVVSHGGQWISGENGALPGIFMFPNPKVGDVFEQERAKGFAEDISEVVAVGLRMGTSLVPAGPYNDCIETKDTDPIGGVVESKFYCPGVGLVREEFEEGFIALARIGTFNASDIDQDLINAIGQSAVVDNTNDGSLAGFNINDYLDEDGDPIMIGTVSSFSNTELTLNNGRTFVLSANTKGRSGLRVGKSIEIEFKVEGGQLIALEID